MCEIRNEKKVTENILYPGFGACGCIKGYPARNTVIYGDVGASELLYSMLARIVEYTNPDKVRLWFCNMGSKNTNPFDKNPSRIPPHVERTSLQCSEIYSTLEEWDTLIEDKMLGVCDNDQIHILVLDNMSEVSKGLQCDIMCRIAERNTLAENSKCFVIMKSRDLPSLFTSNIPFTWSIPYIFHTYEDEIEFTDAAMKTSKVKPMNLHPVVLNKMAKVFGMPRDVASKFCRISPYSSSQIISDKKKKIDEKDVEKYQE